MKSRILFNGSSEATQLMGSSVANFSDVVATKDKEIADLRKQSAKSNGKVIQGQLENLFTDGKFDQNKFIEMFKGKGFNPQIVSTISRDVENNNFLRGLTSDTNVSIVFTRVPNGVPSLTDNFQYHLETNTAKTYSFGLNTTSVKLFALVQLNVLKINTPIKAKIVIGTGNIPLHLRIIDENLEKAFDNLVGNVSAINAPEVSEM